MPQKENIVIANAMRYGLLLGLYFICKFIVIIFSLKFYILNLITLVMMFGIPFLMYHFTKEYKRANVDNNITFVSIWLFVLMTFFYASLPEALVTYVYLQYINPTFLIDQMSVFTDMYAQLAESKENATLMDFITNIKETEIPTAIEYSFKLIYNNIFIGGIIALIVSMLLRVKKPF